MSEALKPCPFCGGGDTLILDGPVEDDWCQVSCDKCHARGPINYSDPHAKAAWNRRADLPAPVRVKDLVWDDGEAYDEDEGPITSEAYGAGYCYLAEAIDCTLAEAKAERQAAFEARILAELEPAPDALADPRVVGQGAVAAHLIGAMAAACEALEHADASQVRRVRLSLLRIVANALEAAKGATHG
jgi:Lar family restriction alleviation protein